MLLWIGNLLEKEGRYVYIIIENDQLLRKCQLSDYTYYQIWLSIVLLVSSFVEEEDRWVKKKIKIMTGL